MKTNNHAPAMLGPEEIAEAVRQYRVRRQREQQPSGAMRPWLLQPPKPLTLWTDVECIAYLVFACESVAHLQGQERALLPVCDRVREWLDGLEYVASMKELFESAQDRSLPMGAALERAFKLGWQSRGEHDAATADRE